VGEYHDADAIWGEDTAALGHRFGHRLFEIGVVFVFHFINNTFIAFGSKLLT